VTDLLGDIGSAEFRAGADRALDWIARYYETLAERPVMARVAPGDIRRSLPPAAPEMPESIDAILDDFERLILPGITHWQHPRFLTFFSAAGSSPGTLAELLTAALNVNGMLWRTSPSVTELEEVATSWLRDAMGLPASFSGVINDTASSGTLYALAAAREAIPGVDVRRDGVAGLNLRLYCSEEAHSSVEKAGIVLGVGQRGVVKIPTDAEFRMDPDALARAIGEDRAAGRVPFAVVATVGTTGVTAIDPVARIAEICANEELWLHVDAAYGGAAAVMPEMRWILDGCAAADSIVVNPMKWLFVPVDCSILYCRREDVLKRAFSIVPTYLATGDGDEVRNLMDFGTSLGRRFRSLKLWFVLRAFGLEGIRARLRAHLEAAQQLAGWVSAEPGFEVLAPVRFSTVVFRKDGADADNQRIVDDINNSGRAYISQTTVRGRLAMRIAIGNLHTRLEDVRAVWEMIRAAA
jgi:aromatic-L-amino-acid decarboxylase